MEKSLVRFHLAAGRNYMKWQVKRGGVVEYHDPEQVSLILLGCRLVNKRTIADRIFSGRKKTVCAWVECDSVALVDGNRMSGFRLFYNPRRCPYWASDKGDNLDGQVLDAIVSNRRSVFAL